MHVEHFNFTDRPFVNGSDNGFFTPNDEYTTALERLEQVLLANDSVGVITGGPGVGKTSLVHKAAKMAGSRAHVAYIDMRLTDPNLLFDMLLLNLGGEATGGDVATALHNLHHLISKHNDEGRCASAVIDVSNLTVERAKKILQLANMASEPGGQLNILLLGPHSLHKLLDTPGLINLRQRVTFRHRARPLSVGETDCYLKEQLKSVGCTPETVLQHGAGIMVYQYVGGVPRLINTLMDAALHTAAANGSSTVTQDIVTEAAVALGWRKLTTSKQPAQNKASAPAQTRAPAPEKPAAEAPEESILSQTSRLMTAALDASLSLEDDEPSKKEPQKAEAAPEKPTAMPEMSAEDPGATGMLRLEDLDARFAEGIFSEPDDDAQKKATG
ncbi:MAG: AAA family ATPase [Gammaproteobacteria bacterium]|nr:AAA family ATPase [Gammaproteobacteria bacterium]